MGRYDAPFAFEFGELVEIDGQYYKYTGTQGDYHQFTDGDKWTDIHDKDIDSIKEVN